MAVDDTDTPNADIEHGSLDSIVLPQGLSVNLETFWTSRYTKQLQGLDALKAWNRWNTDCRRSLWRSLLSRLGVCRRPACPPHHELFSLARSFFPLRSDICVTVFDMGNGRTERTDVPFAKVRQCKLSNIVTTQSTAPDSCIDLSSKPEWVIIRWM